jgi:hypothetical protein
MSKPDHSEGLLLLEGAWFEAIDALIEVIHFNEDAARRIEAADVLLRHLATFHTGLGEPFVPKVRPAFSEDDDDSE